jgi:anaerobic magnesium-protoporphyrin IX monomethyl ester cyclase
MKNSISELDYNLDVTFISPYLNIYALGIRSISSYIKSKGFSSRLIFLPLIHSQKATVPNYHRLYEEKTLNDISELCKDSKFIGISLTSNHVDSSIQLTKHLKDIFDIPIIWGGLHPTVMPDESLEHADFICLGEGELAFLELLENNQQDVDITKTRNFWFKKNGSIIKNKPHDLITELDSLPFQDYSLQEHYILDNNRMRIVLLDSERMKTELLEIAGKDYYMTFTTRGCPYKCSYCCNNALQKLYSHQPILRRRSVDNVIAELCEVDKKFPYIKLYNISDDEFFSSKQEFIEEFSKKYKEKIGKPIFCLANPAYINEKKLSALVDAGLHYMELGIQSGSPETRKLYHRIIKNEAIIESAHILNKFKDRICPPVYDIILDNPYETEDDTLKTIDLVRKLPRPYLLQLFTLTFYPGTELYEKALNDGLIKNKFEEIYRKSYLDYTQRYLNIIIYLINKGIPDWIISILIKKVIIKLFNNKFFTTIFTFIRISAKRLKKFLR